MNQSEQDRSQLVTLDNRMNHKRLISNIDAQAVNASHDLKQNQLMGAQWEASRNDGADIDKKNKSTAFTYNSSLNKLRQSAGDGGVFRSNKNYLSEMMNGSGSFASANNDNSPHMPANMEHDL